MKNTTHIELDRRYAIGGYLLYAVIFVLATVECVSHETYFHIPMFAFFIFAFCTGAYSAITYKLVIEMRVAFVCIFISVLCIAAVSILIMRFELAMAIRTILIMIFNAGWLAYRLRSLRMLYKEAKKQANGGEGK